MVRLTDGLDMTIVVDWDVKPQNPTKPNRGSPFQNLFQCILLAIFSDEFLTFFFFC